MKLKLSLVFGGVAAVLTLFCEYLQLKGLCFRTGYVHLGFFDSLFYALHSRSAVILIVTFCNFVLAALSGLVAAFAFQSVRRG